MTTRSRPKPRAAKRTLVKSQARALAAVKGKRALVTLAAKLAREHGTEAQRKLKRAAFERRTLSALRELVTELALRAQQGKRVHMGELEGWPVCWSDARRAKVKPADLILTPITVDAELVTCARCKKAADLPSPEDTAALKRAEARAAASEGAPVRVKRPAARRRLQLERDLPVRLRVKGLEAKGVLKPDGTLRVGRTTYPSPHAAAKALAGDRVNYRIDGFQAWRYQDASGAWRMLRDYA